MNPRRYGKTRDCSAAGDAAAGEAAFAAAERWRQLDSPAARAEIFDRRARRSATAYQRNVEAYIGTLRTPVGLTGPLRINGSGGSRQYRVPLATTEAALVASYSRGARLVTSADGCTSRVVAAAISRTPMFAFRDLLAALEFARFAESRAGAFDGVVAGVTGHGRLIGIGAIVEGNHVYLDLRFTTGDAAGQNMVTFAAEAVCHALLEDAPRSPAYWFLEANLSGDKKAASRGLAGVRGRRVIADISIARDLVAAQLHTTPERMAAYWSAGTIGGVISGTTGVQGHFANGLAALYLACGQDVACVAESATGITRMEVTNAGALYASVTLPNVVVGSVGGGTALPGARACLDILGLAGDGHATALAELCAGLVLAGELSIVAALCTGDFAAAHRRLSRGEAPNRSTDHD